MIPWKWPEPCSNHCDWKIKPGLKNSSTKIILFHNVMHNEGMASLNDRWVLSQAAPSTNITCLCILRCIIFVLHWRNITRWFQRPLEVCCFSYQSVSVRRDQTTVTRVSCCWLQFINQSFVPPLYKRRRACCAWFFYYSCFNVYPSRAACLQLRTSSCFTLIFNAVKLSSRCNAGLVTLSMLVSDLSIGSWTE